MPLLLFRQERVVVVIMQERHSAGGVGDLGTVTGVSDAAPLCCGEVVCFNSGV